MEKGYILTNNHVVQDADEIQLKLANGETYEGKIVGRDKLPSLMPEGLAQMLSKRELRDIVAFLASQK